MNTGKLFKLAWTIIPKLPGSVARGIFDLIAHVLYLRNGASVRQLSNNIARVAPKGSSVKKLTHQAVRHYMRYYCEVFQLPSFTPRQIVAIIRGVNHEASAANVKAGRSVYAMLTHTGNWDIAGAWAGRKVGPVITVAEKLEPAELFEEFLSFREGLGMTIIPYIKGSGMFRQLLKLSAKTPSLVPLLADRDLGKSGIWVNVAGHRMRVAPGPAALAVASKTPMVGIFSYHERISGERKRVAKSPWGCVLEFTEPLAPNPELDSQAAIEDLCQRWADLFTDFLTKHPDHWHMMQPVFEDDLDLERLARAE